jgi:hypothetical protein
LIVGSAASCRAESSRALEQRLGAGVAEGWALPADYDPGSGQPWTRNRLAYLLHDLHCRALDRRDVVLGLGAGPVTHMETVVPSVRARTCQAVCSGAAVSAFQETSIASVGLRVAARRSR